MNIRILAALVILFWITACTTSPPPQPRVFDETNTTVTVEKRINTSQSVNPGKCTNATAEGDICYDTASNTLNVYNGTALEALH